MIDKDYCMSSYLALRYIEKDGAEFAEGLHHRNIVPLPDDRKTPVRTADDIDAAIAGQMDTLFGGGQKVGIMLSGGMDSAIAASYLPGAEAYTFRFLDGRFQKEELSRAEYYARCYGLHLHYVDIQWDTVTRFLDPVMKAKAAPVHSIEPQIYQAALQAKEDGVEMMFIGDSSDYFFGGMDGLLSQDWTVDAFMDRYIFIRPEDVLRNPRSMRELFEKYRMENDKINFLAFMNDVTYIESFGSYTNAFEAAGMPFHDPYAELKMAEPLDLYRVRHGEPKYLIRELMAKKYPAIPVPDKNPMPRPVDAYFADWKGPSRPEFRDDMEISRYTGNQKWQMWCLERFLNEWT